MKKISFYRSPAIAAAWSVMLPGLGHLYNGDNFVAVILIALELSINNLSGLNSSIVHEFNPSHPHVETHLNHGWLLFYPAIYTFAIWHSYNRAIEINVYSDDCGKRLHQFCCPAISATIGMLLGLIWPVDHKHVLTALSFGFIGIIAGLIVEFLRDKWKQ